ncbi:chemotaxis protein CheW [Stutzerimonas nosocomialis]|uniref:chemotaxis protein CheW n=1 Tax=Stutzerimonas nosocomialis TaxID=1056496 RepID=UPI0011098008|nr:chemotaxis protein CheW [Stutzerimonas nosocomialis]TLX54421.1 chemotaxis protein CheW [Stutzerimonas nosocomialis]
MDSVSHTQHLSFRVQDARYALPLDQVREVIDGGAVTPVPLMPAFVLGIVNLRGCMIPVIDLAARFGLAPPPPGKRTCLVIAEAMLDGQPHRIGLRVQAVETVLEVHADDIDPAPPFGTGIRPDFIAGVLQDDTAVTVMLDLPRLVALEDLQSTFLAGAS